MKKVLLLICVILCLCIIPCNNIYCEEENILDTWNSIKKMHIAQNYREITDLKEDHIYEMNLNSVISNNKGLNINIYINGDKIISTSSQVNIIAQQNNPDLLSGYYYVARGYEQEDESLYLLKTDMYEGYFGRNNFIFNPDNKKLIFRLNDTEEIWLGKDEQGDYDVFYYPFQELNYVTSILHDDDIPMGYFWAENDYAISMNGGTFEVGPYVVLNDDENPFDEYFDFSYDLKTDCIVMNVKKSFTVEPGENGSWIMGTGEFSHSNLKIIGDGEITIEQKVDCGDSSCSAIYTSHNVILGDENSNLKFIYKDLINEDYKKQRFQEENYEVSTGFLYARTLEIYNTSIQSFSTRECISTSLYDSPKEAFVANNCNFDIVLDDIYPYSSAMSFIGGAAIFNNSSLQIKDSYSAIINYSDREGLAFINTSVDIDSYSTCFSIYKPIKFISDDPYINISINQRDGGNMFYWDPEVATIDNPIDISSSNKYMKYKTVEDEDGSNKKIVFYGPSFIFNNIENINEEDINYYFNTENGVLSITNPSKPGYDFAGWYLDEDLTVKWQNNSIIDEPYNFVLHAKWNKKQNVPSYIIPSTGIK